VIVHPCYHPAFGLHSPSAMQGIVEDFRALRKTLKTRTIRERTDPFKGREQYELVLTPEELKEFIGDDVLAIDTETFSYDGTPGSAKPWCVSLTSYPGCGAVVMADNIPVIKSLGKVIRDRRNLVVFHNASFDLRILQDLGIEFPRFTDTMLMASALCKFPRGLKFRAERDCAMKMESYGAIVGRAAGEIATGYLERVLAETWPKPEPVMIWDAAQNRDREKQPQAIDVKVKRILDDTESKGADPVARWRNIPLAEGRGMVEEKLGPMPESDLRHVPLDEAVRYSARDADATLRLYLELRPQVARMKVQPVVDLDCGALRLVMDMERSGLPFSRSQLKRMDRDYASRMVEMEAELERVTGKVVNPASPLQVSQLLYRKLRLRQPRIKGVAKGSTASDVLSMIEDEHPAVKLIMDWRKLKKLRGTYIAVLLEKCRGSQDGRVRASLNVTGTVTGRMSSTKPNLLGLPKRSEEGLRVRRAIVSGPGKVFVKCDFGQMDFRITADLSGDKELCRIFTQRQDIHIRTACSAFNLRASQVDDRKHRLPAKSTGFGVLFGITASGLLKQLESIGAKNWTEEKCQWMIDSFFETYPGVLDYFIRLEAQCRRDGFVRGPSGRIRYTPGLMSSDDRIVEKTRREMRNFPIQEGTGWACKHAMIKIRPLCPSYGARPLLQVHDELVFEVGRSEAPRFALILERVMQDAVKLRVPIVAEAEIGRNLADMKSLKEWEQ